MNVYYFFISYLLHVFSSLNICPYEYIRVIFCQQGLWKIIIIKSKTSCALYQSNIAIYFNISDTLSIDYVLFDAELHVILQDVLHCTMDWPYKKDEGKNKNI